MAAEAAGVNSGTSAPSSGVSGGSSGNVQSVFEAVDGPGTEPKFGVAELGIDSEGNQVARKSKARKSGPTAKAAENDEQAGQGLIPAGGLETETSSWSTEAAKYFETELGGQGTNRADADEEGLEEAEGEQEEAPAKNDRYQRLIERRKAAETQLQAAQAQASQHQQAIQQIRAEAGQAIGQLREQNARMSAQLEMLARGRTEAEDPVAQARRELTSEAERSVFDKHVSPLQRELQQLKNHIQQTEQKQRTDGKAREYQYQARTAAIGVGMKGLPEDVASELLPDFEEEVLSVAWGKRTDMENAAKIVRNRHLRFGLAFVKAQANANKQRMDQVKNEVPQLAPSSRAPSARGGDGLPPWNVLTSNGYKSYTDWQFDGSPTLTWPKK